MAKQKVQIQLLNESNGEVIGDVDPLTSADCVSFSDGKTFQQKYDAGELRGATGAKGDKGETGPQGPQGAKGSTGERGPQGVQGPQGPAGEAFKIAKTYASVSAMNAGFASDGVKQGQFVMIDTGNVNDADNAKLYVKGASSYTYITDLSGATGLTGPQGPRGLQGVKGDPGAAGPKGATGAQGATGPAGPRGATGAKGDKGDPGDSIKVGTTPESATSRKLFFKVIN